MKRLLIIAGPSAGGKTTAAEALLSRRSDLSLIRSVTTRSPRGDGRDGEYIYLDREGFAEAESRGEILESMVYAGESYGTPRSELERVLSEGRTPLLILDLNGVRALTALKEYSSCAVYLYTDLNTCEERLYARYLSSPTPKGLASFVDRKERNIRDFLDMPGLEASFYGFVENGGELESAVTAVEALYSSFLQGKPRYDNSAVASALAAQASEKLK